MSNNGPLWSERQGRGPTASFDHQGVRRIFAALVSEFEARGWFQEFFGFTYVDEGFVQGQLGADLTGALLIETGRSDVWPVALHANSWDDDTLFDMVEFLDRTVSAGAKGRFHDFGGCGWHYSHFDRFRGQLNTAKR